MAFHASDFTGDFSLAGYDEWKCDDSDAYADDYEEMLELEREAYRAEQKKPAPQVPVNWDHVGAIELGDDDIPF